MNYRKIFSTTVLSGALLSVFLIFMEVGPICAATPEGNGEVQLGIGFNPGGGSLEYANGISSGGLIETLSGDLPLFSGFAAGAALSNADQNTNTLSGAFNYQGQDFFTDAQNTYPVTGSVYQANIQVWFYLADFLGKPFEPGENANPDGWIYWPTLNFLYSMQEANFSYPNSSGDNYGDSLVAPSPIHYWSQHNIFELSEPLAQWATVTVGVGSLSPINNSFLEAQLSFYVNWLPGADKDASRAFLPHIGRFGQFAINISSAQGVVGPQLSVAAAVSNYVGVHLAIADADSAIPFGYGLLYSVGASWAFGSPNSRVDE
jgi:hypothetical protein